MIYFDTCKTLTAQSLINDGGLMYLLCTRRSTRASKIVMSSWLPLISLSGSKAGDGNDREGILPHSGVCGGGTCDCSFCSGST